MFTFKSSTSVVLEEPPAYFEQQIGTLCGIHALNNLFQRKEFNKSEIDKIAEQIRIAHAIEGIPSEEQDGGDYNVHTLEAAVISRNYQLEVVHERHLEEASRHNHLPKGSYLIGTRSHWFGVRKFSDNGLLWCLDSLKSKPTNVNEVKTILGQVIHIQDENEKILERFQWHGVRRIFPDLPQPTWIESSSIAQHVVSRIEITVSLFAILILNILDK